MFRLNKQSRFVNWTKRHLIYLFGVVICCSFFPRFQLSFNITLSITRSLSVLARENDARPVPARDACVLPVGHAALGGWMMGMRMPWQQAD